MPTVLIFHNNALIHRAALADDAQLPFVGAMRFPAAALLGRSRSPLVWTERGALAALDTLACMADFPFSVDYAFRRAGECMHSLDSLHLAGCAFDVGKALAPDKRRALGALALGYAGFTRAAPAYQAGYSLHLAWGEPRPALQAGDCRAAVCVLQDALLRGGFLHGALSGCFDAETRRAVLRLQRACGLAETGEVRTREWRLAERLLSCGASGALREVDKMPEE